MSRLPLSLLAITLREWWHHPWRYGVAVLAVALGVALAYSVHLINRSALAEFTSAVRAVNGQPDLSLRGGREGFDDALFDRVAAAAGVVAASPVLEIDTYARRGPRARLQLRVIGIDALVAGAMAPELAPRPHEAAARLAALDPDQVFVNAAAQTQLELQAGGRVALQSGTAWRELKVAGTVAAGGPPLVVMDIAGAQAHFGLAGRITRIDLRLEPGTAAEDWLRRIELPAGVASARGDDAQQRVSNLSRAYRVNLTVLALVALFVGAFLVFSVVALSVAQRLPMLALLGVLGVTARERRALILLECALVGLIGAVVGLLAGAAMAAAALHWLAGDLGGGYFPGIAPKLTVGAASALVFGVLGIGSAVAGGWLPARSAEAIAPAQALKGLTSVDGGAAPAWPGALLLAAGAGLALLPPVAGLPLAAYAAVACLLAGGVSLVPAAVRALLAAPGRTQRPLALLALQRARFARHTATAAVAGVVASLALAGALTVMVVSFRAGVAQWLDQVLPADLYARSAGSSLAAEQAWLPSELAAGAAALPGVERVWASRLRAVQLAPQLPAVVLVTRELADPAAALPLIGNMLPPRAGELGVYVSEAMVALHGASPGTVLALPLGERRLDARVLGVWRDYARQFGTIAIDAARYRELTGDTKINELALRLAPGAPVAGVQEALRRLVPDAALLQFATAGELRELSLRIFDRSFAVTRYLQAVAIGIGLVGIAASLSAQVLARRKEFGLLAHLGLTRAQVIGIVAGEGAAWMAAGALIGLALGVAVAVVLVYVVNPQSFHWSMELVLPGAQLAALAAAVLVCGVATAAFSARGAAGRAAVLSVKEDW